MDSDMQLLARYARTREAEAFTQLVRRHAGMVFAAARRVTCHHHDAEEVTQNCFLELSRQAGSIHGSVAGWLHAVATNRASTSNRNAGRRRQRERMAARPEVVTETPWDDIAPLVDAALAELPDEWRLPAVLYYLEGRSQREVAAELGVHESTISRRLEAAVAALREKLQAAGVEGPCAALPALLAQHATVAVPKTLVAALGKLAMSGLAPGSSGATSGIVSGATGAASGGGGVSGGGTMAAGAKGTAVLGVKVLAAVVITAAVTTAGVALLPKQLPPVAVAAPTDTTAMPDDLKEVVTRLKSEINQGLGDGVGILTETSTGGKNADARFSHPESVTLYAQKGLARLWMDYRLRNRGGPGKTVHRLPENQIPKGWPAPPLDEVLRFADSHQTPYLAVTDGQTLWSVTWHGDTTSIVSTPLDSHDLGGQGLMAISSFWPKPFQLIAGFSKNPNVDLSQIVELVHRPNNPALIGLHLVTKQVGSGDPAMTFTAEWTYWLDPTRNDVPVERDYWLSWNKKAPPSKTEFLEYAQLPSGFWYPTHWRDGGDWRFTFDPEASLDAKWFGDPSAHLLSTPFDGPSPKGIAAVTHAAAALPHAAVVAVTKAARSAWWWWPWALAVAVFGAAGVLAILQRRKQSPLPPLRGVYGRRRR